jgi:co-chaperonin GroES (HSP10)
MPESNEAEMSQEEKDELMERFNKVTNEPTQEELPTLAGLREQEARERAMRVFAAARELASNGMIQACGYRVVVKPLEGTMGLEAAQAAQAPHLAEQGFQLKTHTELEREERGENHGVVIHIGPVAFDRLGGRAAWCDEGDVVLFARYAGTRVEHPPGSGIFYQVMNDEDIFGKIV